MFSVFARRQILARPSAALLSSLLRKVLPRRERADGDERVGNDRSPAVVALAPLTSRLALTAASLSLFHRSLSHLSLTREVFGGRRDDSRVPRRSDQYLHT
jgi:hypothetical protein